MGFTLLRTYLSERRKASVKTRNDGIRMPGKFARHSGNPTHPLNAAGADVDAQISRMGDPVPPMLWLRDQETNMLLGGPLKNYLTVGGY